MADGTGIDHAGVTLQSDRLDVVVGLDGGVNGVLAAVTGLAINPTVTGREAVQFARIFTVRGPMTVRVAAAGFGKPGLPGRIGHVAYIAVAILAGQPFLVHHPAQALGGWAGMALVTIIGDSFVLVVHGQRQAADAGLTGQIQGVRAVAIGAQHRPAVH